jgi:hypothetical protein
MLTLSLLAVRSGVCPLWFDKEKHPEKHDQFKCMLQDEMETIRAGDLISCGHVHACV